VTEPVLQAEAFSCACQRLPRSKQRRSQILKGRQNDKAHFSVFYNKYSPGTRMAIILEGSTSSRSGSSLNVQCRYLRARHEAISEQQSSIAKSPFRKVARKPIEAPHVPGAGWSAWRHEGPTLGVATRRVRAPLLETPGPHGPDNARGQRVEERRRPGRGCRRSRRLSC